MPAIEYTSPRTGRVYEWRPEDDSTPTDADVQWFTSHIDEQEQDTGQSKGEAALNAAARGAISLFPSSIQGAGALIPGQKGEDIRARGKEMQEGLEASFPVNPIHEDTRTVHAAEALGIAASSSVFVVPLLLLVWRKFACSLPEWVSQIPRKAKIAAACLCMLAFGVFLQQCSYQSKVRQRTPAEWVFSGSDARTRKVVVGLAESTPFDEPTFHNDSRSYSGGESPSEIMGHGIAVLCNAAQVFILAYISRLTIRLPEIGKLKAYGLVFAWSLMFAVLAGYSAGSHWEGVGEESFLERDFEPTRAQRLAYMGSAFIVVAVSAGIGAILGWRDRTSK